MVCESCHDRRRAKYGLESTFQAPISMSFSPLTEFWGESSARCSQPTICVPMRTHRVWLRTHRVLVFESVLSKCYSACFQHDNRAAGCSASPCWLHEKELHLQHCKPSQWSIDTSVSKFLSECWLETFNPRCWRCFWKSLCPRASLWIIDASSQRINIYIGPLGRFDIGNVSSYACLHLSWKSLDLKLNRDVPLTLQVKEPVKLSS